MFVCSSEKVEKVTKLLPSSIRTQGAQGEVPALKPVVVLSIEKVSNAIMILSSLLFSSLLIVQAIEELQQFSSIFKVL